MKTLMIVEDELFVREMLSEDLTRQGYSVICVENGEQALTCLEEYLPQVIVLDLKMPRMSGIEFLHAVKARRFQSAAIIVLTGHGTNREMQECYALGVHSFLRKPVNIYELNGVVKRSFALLDYEAQLQQEIEAKAEEIQAKNQAYLQLKAQNRVLKDIFESMAEGAIILDKSYRIRMISANACKMLRVAESEVLEKPAVAVLGTAVAGPGGELALYTEQPQKRTELVTHVVAPTGVSFSILLSIIPLMEHHPEGEVLLLFRERENDHSSSIHEGVVFGKMISADPTMDKIFGLIARIAPKDVTVLVEGESGTGKELVAREIHTQSSRAHYPFHAVNCAAISPQLLESEFFGHERGAFTGAYQAKKGRFELAHQGTLFLDEIGELPLELQGKLLRALEEQCFERVGGTQSIQVDVRLISASNRNLKQMVEQQQFREDLYYRLCVTLLSLPPLRERAQDIVLLTSAFIKELNRRTHRQVSHMTSDALQLLMGYPWPGNVRELFHCLENAFAISDGTVLHKEHLPDTIRSFHAPAPQNEKELILQALQQTNFNKPKAAALLGIHRATLYRKISKYQLEV